MHRFDRLPDVIELAILGLLREQDLHGYELRKRISELDGTRTAISFGSLYPALARLEAMGAVKAVEANTGGKPIPMTGSLSGEAAAYLARRRSGSPRGSRGKKVYGITERGEHVLDDLLDDPSTDDKAFALKVAFCRYLPTERRLDLFERRRAQLAGHLAGERTQRRRTTTERLDLYLRALRDHDHETTQHDIAWLDRLIAAERAQEDTTP